MKPILWFAGGVVALLVIIGLSTPTTPSTTTQNLPLSTALAATTTAFDFGSTSMAKGLVRHEYTITNTSAEPITLAKLYTSCMCTEATLNLSGRTYGPFGMPGHGPITALDAALQPGETATVEAVFDPAAHGPAGVGPVERIVTLTDQEGNALNLTFTAVVTP